MKARLSLVELLFRALEERVRSAANGPASRPLLGRSPEPLPASDGAEAAVAAAIRELNDRFRQAMMGLHYHNGVLQFAKDELTK